MLDDDDERLLKGKVRRKRKRSVRDDRRKKVEEEKKNRSRNWPFLKYVFGPSRERKKWWLGSSRKVVRVDCLLRPRPRRPLELESRCSMMLASKRRRRAEGVMMKVLYRWKSIHPSIA